MGNRRIGKPNGTMLRLGFFILLNWLFLSLPSGDLWADDFDDVMPLVVESCIDCHDGSGDSSLDLGSLDHDLENRSTFDKWVKVFDRVNKGEMPPPSEVRPPEATRNKALAALKSALKDRCETSRQKNGRVWLRRITRTEFEYILNDVLGINTRLAEFIPAENKSTSFDTVFASQGFSTQHVRGYFEAADRAIDEAIRLSPSPDRKLRRFEYKLHPGLRKHMDEKEERVIVGETDDGIIMFSNASYLFKVPDFHASQGGYYRIRAAASPYQSKKPVILTINAGSYQRGLQEVVGFFDLKPGKVTEVEVTTYLEKQQYLFPGVDELLVQADGKTIWNIGPDEYQGSGVELKWIEVEGPLVSQWPPKCTTDLLHGVEIRKLKHDRWDSLNDTHIRYEIVPEENPREQLHGILERLASRAFRRSVSEKEIEEFLDLGMATLNDGRSFEQAIRVACRAVLSSPQVLFVEENVGELTDDAIATRLSLFLWKSTPDQQLRDLASRGELHRPSVLKSQVERMLTDERSKRFIRDFVGQWLQLTEIDATSPDDQLYPEFDELLKKSMLAETEAFIAELISKDLSCRNLIDSDFAMINRRLADHYGIDGVDGQSIQYVALPKDSPRGGLLTHASVLKVTANGTTTSPVRRGSWVLTHLLGRPPSPPPPSVGTIEPDTRGATTVRQMLEKHRNDASCASCHRAIDPPGFALESFDVIGGHRERFRSKEHGDRPETTFEGRKIWEYKLGMAVDCAGELEDGRTFQGIEDYKKLLMDEQEQVARNLISQLIVYSTGGEISFSDRDVVERILDETRSKQFGLRSIIHEVVQSELFLEK